MRILHTYCLNYNIGDYALGIGVKNLLRKYLDVDFIGETNIQGREFSEYYIHEVVNKKYDLLVIGGGGIIHGAHWPNGWFWLIEKDLIKQIKIPFIVFGVGNNYWNEETQIPEHGIEHLKETSRLANYFSVRNDGSEERLLQQTGIQANVVPDPGFHVNLSKKITNPVKDPFVVIQLANDKVDFRFGGMEGKQKFIGHMRKVVSQLAKEYQVIFAPHVFDDIDLSKRIAEGIKNTHIWDYSYFAFDHTDEVLGYYKHAQFVIAMRGHGQIIPISFNTPVVSISNHPKHEGLMRELDLFDYNVNLKHENLAEMILGLVDHLNKEKTLLIEKYAKINQRLSDKTKIGFEIIKASLMAK